MTYSVRLEATLGHGRSVAVRKTFLDHYSASKKRSQHAKKRRSMQASNQKTMIGELHKVFWSNFGCHSGTRRVLGQISMLYFTGRKICQDERVSSARPSMRSEDSTMKASCRKKNKGLRCEEIGEFEVEV